MNTSRKVFGGIGLFIVCASAWAQVTAAKPSTYSLDTGETHFPDQLYLMDEGTGTALEDRGAGTDQDLTCSGTTGGGPDWITDGTHGPALDFVAANEDVCLNSSLSSLSGTHTFCVIAMGTAGSGSRSLVSLADPSQADRFVQLVFQGDEDLEASSRFDNTTQTNTSTTDMTGGYDLACIRFSDSTVDWSLNGSAWDTFAVSHTGLMASLTRIALGARSTSSPTHFWDDIQIAAFGWDSSKSDADMATIYNSGNPWPIIGVDATVAPTISGASVGTVTSSTAPTNFTLDQTGTVYGIVCTDGQTASVAQTKTGTTCSGGASISSFSEAVVGGVPDSHTFTGLSASTTYDAFLAGAGTGGDTAAVTSLLDIVTSGAGAPVFDSGPTVSSQTASAYTISYDASAAADNIYVVAVKKDSATCTCDQIEAQTCAGELSNSAYATEATTGSADSIVLSGLGADPFPVHDIQACLEDGTTDSTVAVLPDEYLDPPTGRQWVVKSGSPGGGEYGLLDGASPAAANDDVIDVDAYSDSFAQGDDAHIIVVNQDTTYHVIADEDSLGAEVEADTSRQTVTRRFYDVSAGAWSDASAVLYCINDQAPVYVGLEEYEGSIPYLFERNVAASLLMDGLWDDPEDDAMSHTTTNLPTGLSDDGEEISGTPTTFGYYSTVSLEATDICGDAADEVVQFVVGLRLPDVTSWLLDESLWKSRSIFTGAAANAAEYDTYLPRAVNY